MTTKIAHSSKRPNSNNRAAKRKRLLSDYENLSVVWVLLSRITYRGSTKANRARIRLRRTTEKNDALFQSVRDLHPNISLTIRPSIRAVPESLPIVGRRASKSNLYFDTIYQRPISYQF